MESCNEPELEGGGGAADREGAGGGGRGAVFGGRGGTEAGVDAVDGGGAGLDNDGGAGTDGFRRPIGAGGGLGAPGKGGAARGDVISVVRSLLREVESELGLGAGLGGTFRRLATNGFVGCEGDDSVV